jgi:hypothetical protein
VFACYDDWPIALPVHDTVLDGEIVHLGNDGRPQFCSLLRRRSPQQFAAFDVLWLNGKYLRQQRLVERKRIRRSALPHGAESPLYAEHVDGTRCAPEQRMPSAVRRKACNVRSRTAATGGTDKVGRLHGGIRSALRRHDSLEK